MAGPLPPVTATLPAWLVTMTVLTGTEIWYTAVALCVPGIDTPGLALAEADEGGARWPRPTKAWPSWTCRIRPGAARPV